MSNMAVSNSPFFRGQQCGNTIYCFYYLSWRASETLKQDTQNVTKQRSNSFFNDTFGYQLSGQAVGKNSVQDFPLLQLNTFLHLEAPYPLVHISVLNLNLKIKF